MLATAIADSYTLQLPPWVREHLADVPERIEALPDRMQLVHDLAERNYREGNGGPFAALVSDADSGEIVSVGVNVVLASRVSSAHAEVMALALAQTRIGDWNLAAGGRELELVVNWRPCAQCYGATFWSGVRHLVVAGSGPELEEITGFDEGPVRDDWKAQFEDRGIRVTEGLLRDEALAVFRDYRDHVAATGAIVYNPREIE